MKVKRSLPVFLVALVAVLMMSGCGNEVSQTPSNAVADDNSYNYSEVPDIPETSSSDNAANTLNVIASGTFDGVPYAIWGDEDKGYHYHLTIGEEDKTYTFLGETKKTSSWPWNDYNYKITSAEFLGHVNGYGDMSYMFYYMERLKSIDFTNFDTSNVQKMGAMFLCCTDLEAIDLSNFDVTNVRDMHQFFFQCVSLTDLDLSNFNTTSAESLSNMFCGCENLSEVDISGFKTTNTTSMEYMFRDCPNLSKITVGSGFVNASRENFSATFPSAMKSESTGTLYNADDVIPDGADVYIK